MVYLGGTTHDEKGLSFAGFSCIGGAALRA